MAEEKKANNNNHNKVKHLEHFFCSVGVVLGIVVYCVIRSVVRLGILPSIALGASAGCVGSIMGLGIYRLGKKLGKAKGFKGISNVLTKEIYLSKKICVDCPQCGGLLKGATREMIGDTGVCPKCKAEFVIKQEQ